MNNLISKAIQAIKDNKIDYALGILESVMEMGDKPAPVAPVVPHVVSNNQPFVLPRVQPVEAVNPGEMDEAAMMDNMARAAMGTIKSDAISTK